MFDEQKGTINILKLETQYAVDVLTFSVNFV